MKLLVVTRERTGERGYGLGKTIGNIAHELSQRGHEVVYFSAEGWGEHEQKRMNQIGRILQWCVFDSDSAMLCGAWGERLLQGWRAAKAARTLQATHVWFQDPWLVAGFWIGGMRYGRWKIPYRWGVTEHGLGSFEAAVLYDGLIISETVRQKLKRYERFVTQRGEWVWSPTACALEKLRSDLGYLEAPSHWRVMGYGAPRFNPIDRHEARRRLGWDEETLYVLCIGRITPAKGIDKAIRAVEYVQRHSSLQIKLIILGDGDRRWAQEIANDGGVDIDIGFVPNVEDYLYGGDIYIGSGSVESFGYANLEAISCGIASIVIRGGANEEVVGSGGWIVDEVDLNRCVLEMAQDPHLREKWRQSAIKYVEHYPSWVQRGEEYEHALVG